MRKQPLIITFVLACLFLVLTKTVIAQVPPYSPNKEQAAVQLQAQNVELVGQIGNNTVSEVAVNEKFAYIDDVDSHLVTLDVTDVTRPLILGQTGASPKFVSDIAVNQAYAYIADWTAGLRIVDIATPSNPAEVGFLLAQGEEANSVTIAGKYAYVSDYNRNMGGGLSIVDVSSPTSPIEVGFYQTQYANTLDTAVVSHYAYVLTYGNLRVVDISNPATPVMIGSCKMPTAGAVAVAVQGDYAYIGARGAGLRIVDISNPASPVEIGFYDTPGSALAIAVQGNYVYVADQTALRIFDVSNPANLTEVGSYEALEGASDVAVEGNYVYVATSSGLFVFWFAPPATGFISSAGGNLASSEDNVTYQFSTGTFTDTVFLSHFPRFPRQTQLSSNQFSIGRTFDMTAVYSGTDRLAQPTQPYTITIQYAEAEKGVVVENTLGLFWWDEETLQWSQQGITSTVDIINNLIVAQVGHFSLFSVIGQNHCVYLPLVTRNY